MIKKGNFKMDFISGENAPGFVEPPEPSELIQHYGVDVVDEIENLLVEELAREIDNQIINELFTEITNNRSFTANIPFGHGFNIVPNNGFNIVKNIKTHHLIGNLTPTNN